MYNISFLKATKSILKGQQAKWFLFFPIWLIFCIQDLEFVALKSRQNVQEIFMQKNMLSCI